MLSSRPGSSDSLILCVNECLTENYAIDISRVFSLDSQVKQTTETNNAYCCLSVVALCIVFSVSFPPHQLKSTCATCFINMCYTVGT